MTTVPGTQVGALLPGTHQVATHHRQAVERLGAGLIVAASTADGTVEAIGSSRYRFAVGVQWPPEMGVDAPVVQALVAAAGSAEGTGPARTAGRNTRTVRSAQGRIFPTQVS
ncbi:gamma-glutamyl-gamma-aminobutyrate hydrolase family protein [Streptomyces sp. NPDC049949]|uniref:gamma-glutamyl-gamma-aminobutyrate hydrolase family protein n=1 Tax=Streptomyces sp. NPDC049949 TaxID=3154627 RepID=UPI0034148E75